MFLYLVNCILFIYRTKLSVIGDGLNNKDKPNQTQKRDMSIFVLAGGLTSMATTGATLKYISPWYHGRIVNNNSNHPMINKKYSKLHNLAVDVLSVPLTYGALPLLTGILAFPVGYTFPISFPLIYLYLQNKDNPFRKN
jgi:hypothetical protein